MTMRRIALAMLCAAAFTAQAGEFPSFADVRGHYVTSDAELLDRNGTPIATARVSATVRATPPTRREPR